MGVRDCLLHSAAVLFIGFIRVDMVGFAGGVHRFISLFGLKVTRAVTVNRVVRVLRVVRFKG
jgi:hypothetical protein